MRVRPRPVEQWDEGTRALLRGHLHRADTYLTGRPDAPPLPNVLGVLVHHERLAGAWLAYNAVLLQQSSLEARLRELVILRVAHRSRSRYEWIQHRRLGAQAGLTSEQIDAVRTGSGEVIWTPLERLLLAATDELLDHQVIADGTWAELETELDLQQLLELLFVVGTYLCLALVLNSVDLEPDPEE